LSAARALGWLIVALGLSIAAPTVRAQDGLVIDLSETFVPITTGFSGTRLLLYGVTDGASDVVVVVRGFRVYQTVRKKERLLGIWVNRRQLTFERVPAFYTMAASGPLDVVMDKDERKKHEVGLENISVAVEEGQKAAVDVDVFREALLRAKIKQGLYYPVPRSVSLVGNRLFRTSLVFPVNVPVGVYVTDVYLTKNGKVVEQKTTFIEVRKFGLEAQIFEFARSNSLAYGVFAILIAALAGWIAAVALRKT